MPLYDLFAASKTGPTLAAAFNGVAGPVLSGNIIALLTGALIGAPPPGTVALPLLFVLRATTNCYVLQHNVADSTPGAAGMTTPGVHLLFAGTYWPMIIESTRDARVSVLSTTATTGTLFFTISDRAIPLTAILPSTTITFV